MKETKAVHPVQAAAHAYVGAFVDQLVGSGLRHVVICPGSRSTPLALLMAEHDELNVWVHIDERSAGFFALGLAKATEGAVALVATSGTAVANFLPAVTEAFFGRVPLLLLTADRPPELRDVGSNQTIFQPGVFGDHVKWAVDMPLPEAREELVAYARAAGARAMATAQAEPAGPVQLNFPLREPLIPLPAEDADDATGGVPERYRNVPLGGGSVPGLSEPSRNSDTAKGGAVDVWEGVRALSDEMVEALATELAEARRPLIVCGPDTPADARQPLLNLAERLGIPLLAEPLSGMRTTGRVTDELIDAYDIFLRFEQVVHAVPPSLVVRVGALPVSKPLLQYLQHYADIPQIVIDEGGGWRDPLASAARLIHADAALLCRALLDAVDGTEADSVTGSGSDSGTDSSADSGVDSVTGLAADLAAGSAIDLAIHPAPPPRRATMWPSVWRRLNDITRDELAEQLQTLEEPFEGLVFDTLAGLDLDGVNLYVGNSMPVRDVDTFFPAGERSVRMFGNRGVSGIDGVVSSALGVSAAAVGPTLLILGDLSFYHDLNGLLAASRHTLDLTVVVVNNDGGGIFSFLPQAKHGRHFEKLFGTPTNLDFAPVVGMYGGKFSRTSDAGSLQEQLASTLRKPGLHVIEYVTNREQNAALHRRIVGAVGEELLEQLSSVFRSAWGNR